MHSGRPYGEWLRTAGFWLVFVWFLLGGIGHFVWTEAMAGAMPPYVPFPREVVLATGVCELAGAFGLLFERLRRVAGLALMVFTVCVTPVHVEMLLHAERYPELGAAALWGRLLFQPVFVWIIWVATKARAA